MKAFFHLILLGLLSLFMGGMVQELTEITVGKNQNLPNLSFFYGIGIFAIIFVVKTIIHYRNLGRKE